MYPWQTFQFCPQCGTAAQNAPAIRFRCQNCRYVLYFNPAVGVAGIIVDRQGRILMLRRQRDPHQGKLGIPGGFVDHGESVDDGLRREIKEETGLIIDELEYLASYPNQYRYEGITYQICDVFFVGHVDSFKHVQRQAGEVAEVLVVTPNEVRLHDMAFDSNRRALQDYLQRA